MTNVGLPFANAIAKYLEEVALEQGRQNLTEEERNFYANATNDEIAKHLVDVCGGSDDEGDEEEEEED